MLVAVIEALAGAALLLAGATKVGHLQRFSRTVAAYEIVGWRASLVVGHTLPFAEIGLGAALALGLLRPWPAAAAAMLFAAFAAALAVNRLRGRTHLACGCFRDEAPRPLTWVVVARPALLAAATAATVLAGSPGLPALADPAGLPPADRFLLAALGTLLAIVALAIADVRTAREAGAHLARPPTPPAPALLRLTKDAR